MLQALKKVTDTPFVKNFYFNKNNKSSNKENKFPLKKLNPKEVINYTFNGASSAFSLLTFILSNTGKLGNFQEKLENISEILSKVAFSIISLVGSVDFWQKKNLIPFLGYTLAVPTAILSSGYDFWLSLGISSGLSNFIVIIDQREIVDDKGNPILDKGGNIQVINGDFKSRGWLRGLEITYKESIRMLAELIKNPLRFKKFSHSALVCSLFEMLGPLIGLIGFKTTGSAIRNIATIGVESSALLHKDIKSRMQTSSSNKTKAQKIKGINFNSPIAQSGFLWILTSIIDHLKRFDFVSTRINGLTSLSFLFDRLASIRFNQGVLNIKNN